MRGTTRRHRPWDAADDRVLRACWEQMTAAQLCERLRVTFDTLRKRAAELGLPPRRRGRRAAGESNRGAAKSKEELVADKKRETSDRVRRWRVRQPDPVELGPPTTMFGAPLRRLDAETQRLVDEAMEKRRTR